MSLVERLMGLNSDGSVPIVAPDQPKIRVHAFFAAGNEIIMGRLTVAAVKTLFEMDSNAQAEFDSLVALAPTGSSALATALKAQYVESIHAVFLLAEGRYTGYATPAEVRAKLGIT